MPATKNKKVSPPKRGKRPSPTKSTKQNEDKVLKFNILKNKVLNL